MKRLLLGVLVSISTLSSLSTFAQFHPSVDANQLIDKSRSISDLVERRAFNLNQSQLNRINQLLTQINETIISSVPGQPGGGGYPPPGGGGYPPPGGGGYPPPGGGGYPPPGGGYGMISFSQLVLAGIQGISDAQNSVKSIHSAMDRVSDPFIGQLKSMCAPISSYQGEKECLVRGLGNIGNISLDQTAATKLLRPLCSPINTYQGELSCIKSGLGVINSQQGQFVLSSCSVAGDATSQVQCFYRGLMI
ncbi:MAG: hypothetical protein ACOYL6_00960 [Bacteriovoracaceae bacterium]